MLPHSGVSTSGLSTAPPIPIDIRRFPWIRRLVADYAFDYPRLAEFYAGSPADPAAWATSIQRTQQHTRQRGAIADLIQAQQRGRGAPAEALAAAAQLRDSNTVAVVTGQQAGLFGGPLFTLLKALTAVRLAERVREEHHVPVISIFWIDAEDHDWDEVKRCGVLDADSNRRVVELGDPPGAHTAAIARVRLDDSVTAALAALSHKPPADRIHR